MSLLTAPIDDIAVLGAHCDDIAIGMGATLLTLCRANTGVAVHALVPEADGTFRPPPGVAAPPAAPI